MPPLDSWLVSFAVPCLLSVAATFVVLRWLFREQLCAAIECEAQAKALEDDGKLVLGGLGIMVAVLLTASLLDKDLDCPPVWLRW
jgi:arsenical pump membrane protein